MWNKKEVSIEQGLDRVARFIFEHHGSQDWETTIYLFSDYLAAFLGSSKKEVYEDLMVRMKEKGEKL